MSPAMRAAETKVSRILSETILTIPEAQKKIKEELKTDVGPATLHRWIKHGVGGVKLEVVRIGRRNILTSSEAIHRFIVARNAKG